MADANELQIFLLTGKLTHRWSFAGKEVVYDLFPVGTRDTVERQVSGLDAGSRLLAQSMLSVAHSLRSIGGYDFQASLDEKLKFVRGLMDPVFDLFAEELRSARIKQYEAIEKVRDDLKKSQPDQL